MTESGDVMSAMQVMVAGETEAQFERRRSRTGPPICVGESSLPWTEREQKTEQHLEIAVPKT